MSILPWVFIPLWMDGDGEPIKHQPLKLAIFMVFFMAVFMLIIKLAMFIAEYLN